MGIGEDTGGRTVRPYSLSCTVCSVNMHCHSRPILAQGKDKTSRKKREKMQDKRRGKMKKKREDEWENERENEERCMLAEHLFSTLF